MIDSRVVTEAAVTGAGGAIRNNISWCRFRRDEHCWYPHDLDPEGSKEAGYPTFLPIDRGICPRIDLDDQADCPVGAPGPHAPGPHFSDGSRRYQDGGYFYREKRN